MAEGSGSLYDPRRHVRILSERVRDVSSVDYPGHFPGEDHSWDLAKFTENFHLEVQRLSQRSVEFDLVGVDASIANAFRRIMIAEVPTVAIESVYAWDNTSIIVDEVLSQRIGLIPIHVDPRRIDVKSEGDESTDRNTLVFNLDVRCSRNTKAKRGATADSELYINHEVLSSHLQWVPQGEQAEVFEADPPRATNPNIVLAKLRPGQAVKMELHAVRGVGKDHAKFSPVATASYRLLPLVVLNPDKPVPKESAEKFAACFAPGVIHVDKRSGKVRVEEKNLRKDTVSREVLRHPEFEGCVELKRIRDFFLFHVESESAYPPEDLLPEAIQILRGKIAAIRQATEALLDEDQTMDSQDAMQTD
ncbi:DNA-directed RNA polymerase [Pterulicium gracile]|uniref:DNA-directed RNA polymerases I and III subunit RPAC1 n=1 Tax=Pterulicium gracile TaxID=1884261 RepID=A0A5C3QVD2_9AGAR|nr:DNA-directed RNA polymerase [Pterula gracilis]